MQRPICLLCAQLPAGPPRPNPPHLDGLKAPVPGAMAFLLLQLRRAHPLHGRQLPCTIPFESLHGHRGAAWSWLGTEQPHRLCPQPAGGGGSGHGSQLAAEVYGMPGSPWACACPPALLGKLGTCLLLSSAPGQELLGCSPDTPESPWPPCCISHDGRVGASLLTSESLRTDTAQGGSLPQPRQVPLPHGPTFSSSSASFCSMSSLARCTSSSMSAHGVRPRAGCGLSSSPLQAQSARPWLPVLPAAPLAAGLYAASPSVPWPKGTNSCGCST